MKKITHAIVLAMVMALITFNGAFSSGHQKQTDRPDKQIQAADNKPAVKPERPTKMSPASREKIKKEKSAVIKDFQNKIRTAERKFKDAEKSAAGLQGQERKTAVRNAAAEMKATIKAAEEKKNAALKEIETRAHAPAREVAEPGKEIRSRKDRR
jgi:hypothetical protein